MDGTAVLKASLDMGQQWLMALVADVHDAPTTFPTPRGGNHPLWVLGHIAHSEASLVAEFVLGEANPLAKWDALFGMGSQPVADATAYPSFDEVLAEFQQARARTLAVLDTQTDATLSAPSKAPAEGQEMFGTIGKCLAGAVLHAAFHTGQIADARRAMGKAPVFG